jgi:hypothetical protein
MKTKATCCSRFFIKEVIKLSNIFFISFLSAFASDSLISDGSSKQSYQVNSLGLVDNVISDELIEPGLLDLGATPIWLDYWLNWTHCQIHLSGAYEPVEITLPGFINSNKPEILRLFVTDPHPGGVPNLYYIHNVSGNSPPMETSANVDIPLKWEISLDNGPFKPITLLPDNSLTTIFPPGQHNFQIKITCLLQPYQADGYYRLQLSQTLVPQL